MADIEVKTSELSGNALAWAVATLDERTLGLYYTYDHFPLDLEEAPAHERVWRPDINHLQGGELLYKMGVSTIKHHQDVWTGVIKPEDLSCGTKGAKYEKILVGATPLVAGMRCIVAAFHGDTVMVPRHLLEMDQERSAKSNPDRPRG